MNYTGDHYHVEGARDLFHPFQPHVPLCFGGSSPAAMKVAAKYIDVYLTWGEPPQQVGEKNCPNAALGSP